MKSFKQNIILLISLLVLTLSGCEEKVLDKEPKQSFSEKDIWGNIELVKKYVWNKYNAINWKFKNNGDRPIFSFVMTDHGHNVFGDNYGTRLYNKGQVTPDNLGVFDGIWESKYENIRDVNVFFQRIDEVEGDEKVKNRLKGEMRFIRAWNYAELIRFFGGVPIITEPFQLKDDFQRTRDSYEACVDFIVEELNQVANNEQIPLETADSEWGRVNKGAALALKSEVLLYAASKLHDPETEPSGPLYDYDKDNKWQAASDAAEAVMDLGVYSLVQVDNWKEYQEMFLSKNQEIIFARQTHPRYTQYMRIDQQLSPNGFQGANTSYTPTPDLVSEFQMEDGESVGNSPLYDPSPNSIYKNREMRFYANIVYNGVEYRGREVEFYIPGGQDSEEGPGGWQASETGYAIRKYMDESFNWFEEVGYPVTPRIHFRLAEIYLNYAEAEYHLGNEDEARKYVNMIRSRANLPDIGSSGQELLEDIRHERNVELCFEGHRFFDVRRWMTTEDEFKDAMGIEWKYVDNQGNLDIDGELTYDMVTVQSRNFRQRQYYLPIPLTEVNRTNMQQNWGY